jgi:hypothetical protein
MKTKTDMAAFVHAPFSGNSAAKGNLRLKEMQGSFALEGIQVSDEQLAKHAAEYTKLKSRR